MPVPQPSLRSEILKNFRLTGGNQYGCTTSKKCGSPPEAAEGSRQSLYHLYHRHHNRRSPLLHFFPGWTGKASLHGNRRELYELFNSYELDDLSFLNEVDNHYEHSELTEISLHARGFHPQDDLEAATIRDMEYIRLHAAIGLLPEIQRRRVHLYFFEEYTYEEIAVMEGCTKRAVKFSIDLALQNLKEKY